MDLFNTKHGKVQQKNELFIHLKIEQRHHLYYFQEFLSPFHECHEFQQFHQFYEFHHFVPKKKKEKKERSQKGQKLGIFKALKRQQKPFLFGIILPSYSICRFFCAQLSNSAVEWVILVLCSQVSIFREGRSLIRS